MVSTSYNHLITIISACLMDPFFFEASPAGCGADVVRADRGRVGLPERCSNWDLENWRKMEKNG